MVALSSFRDQSRICARRMRDRRVRRALMSLNTRGCGDPGLTRATYSRPRVGAMRPEIPLGHGPAFGAGPVRRTGDINEPHSKAWNWLGRVRIRGPASANSATGPTNDQGSCRVSGWWVWVARSEGFRCDGWSASSHPARARSFRHHGSIDLVNLSALLDDATCFAFVRQHRWPEGMRCPGCGSGAVIRNGCDDTQRYRQRYRCKVCAGRFDDLTGTVLAGHHQPLRVWVRAYHIRRACGVVLGVIAAEHDLAFVFRLPLLA